MPTIFLRGVAKTSILKKIQTHTVKFVDFSANFCGLVLQQTVLANNRQLHGVTKLIIILCYPLLIVLESYIR
jgi:hypothetical protein